MTENFEKAYVVYQKLFYNVKQRLALSDLPVFGDKKTPLLVF